MGLDLTVSLTKTTTEFEFIKNKLINTEDLNLHKNSYNKYYRLNWFGVGKERKFSNFIMDFLTKTNKEKLSASVNIKNAKANPTKLFLVTGYKKTRFQENQYYQEVVFGESIKKVKNCRSAKLGNILKLHKAVDYGKDVFLNRFKIYDFNMLITNRFSSVLDMIALGSWGGGNGDSYVLKHTDKGITVYECSEQCINEDEDQYEMVEDEIYVLEELDLFTEKLNENILFLERFIENNVNEDYGYIASNNLTLLLMVKEFLNNKDSELFSYFG